MRLRPRRILTGPSGQLDSTLGSVYPSARTANSTTPNETPAVAYLNKGAHAEEDDDGSQELAASRSGTDNFGASEIVSRAFYGDLLMDFMPSDESAARNGQGSRLFYEIYRDMYYYDPVAGASVDMYSALPFGDFSLAGISDPKGLRPFEASLENTKMRSMMPHYAVNYLVNGMYVCEMKPKENDNEFVYDSIIPHDPRYVTIEPKLEFGKDPKVTVDIGRAIAEANIGMDYKGDKIRTIPAEHLIYMARSGLFGDHRGTSIYKRILPIWLFEKSIIRGTLDQVTKRLRAIPVITVGDEEWIPSPEQMGQITAVLNDAMMDPVGASIVMRNGVNFSEIMRPDDFWKWGDVTDMVTQMKLRGLGMSEAFISGDATLATVEASMSVFIERLREMRDSATRELFYDRMFPTIAARNNITKARFGLHSEMGKKIGRRSREDALYRELADADAPTFDPKKHLLPEVVWHKKLRPEGDEAYVNLLGVLEEKGVPISVQMWAAAGGIDLDKTIQAMDEDIEYRRKMADWAEKKKQFAPKQEGEEEFAGYSGVKPMHFATRNYERIQQIEEAAANVIKGRARLSTSKGRQHSRNRIHRILARAAAELAQQENARDRVNEDKSRSIFGRKTFGYRK